MTDKVMGEIEKAVREREQGHCDLWERLQGIDGLNNVQIAPSVMARYIKDKVRSPNLYIEWLADHFAAQWIEEYSLPHQLT